MHWCVLTVVCSLLCAVTVACSLLCAVTVTQNRAVALKVLKARIFENERKRLEEERRALRRSLVCWALFFLVIR